MNLTRNLPDFYVIDPNNQDMIKLLEVDGDYYDQKYEYLNYLKDQCDFTKIEDRFLPLKLKEMGWTLDLDLTPQQRRKLYGHIVEVNHGRGTNSTIEDTLYLLFEIEFSLTMESPESLGYFVVGKSRIGKNSRIGSGTNQLKNVCKIITTETLTPELLEKVKKVVNYLRPVCSEYLFEWEIGAVKTKVGFVIGKAKIGIFGYDNIH